MKEYFTANEISDLLYITHLVEINRTTVDEWLKRDNLTKEEAKYLRLGCTYTEKFMVYLLKRMPAKQVEKFMLRTVKAMKTPVRIVDKWTQDRIFGNYEKEMEVVKMPRKEFEYLAMTLIDTHCRTCNKSFDKCDLYTLLDNNLFPTCDKGKKCPYAFVAPGEEGKKKEKGKVSKRKQKKLANRFDEE